MVLLIINDAISLAQKLVAGHMIIAYYEVGVITTLFAAAGMYEGHNFSL
jgi:hypothetical protein